MDRVCEFLNAEFKGIVYTTYLMSIKLLMPAFYVWILHFAVCIPITILLYLLTIISRGHCKLNDSLEYGLDFTAKLKRSTMLTYREKKHSCECFITRLYRDIGVCARTLYTEDGNSRRKDSRRSRHSSWRGVPRKRLRHRRQRKFPTSLRLRRRRQVVLHRIQEGPTVWCHTRTPTFSVTELRVRNVDTQAVTTANSFVEIQQTTG